MTGGAGMQQERSLAPLVFYVKLVLSGVRSLFAHHVFRVVIVLAYILANIVVGIEIGHALDDPWLGVRRWVVYGELNFKVPEVGPAHAFDHVHLFGVRMALWIEP